MSAPAGVTADGLPVGMRIVANSYRDRSAISAAGLLEQTLGAFTAPPLVTSMLLPRVAVAPVEEPDD